MAYNFKDFLRMFPGAKMQTYELAYKFLDKGPNDMEGVGYFDVKPGETIEIKVQKWTAYFRNVSNFHVFYGPKPDGKERNWLFPSGARGGPISADESLYFYLPSSATETARIYYAFVGVV